MSYCRWSNSCWYVYEDSNGGETKNEQLLTVFDHGSYTYADLKQGYDHILERIRKERFDRNPLNYKGEGKAPKDRFTEDEIQELKGYFDRFIKNVEFRFDPENIKKFGDLVTLLTIVE